MSTLLRSPSSVRPTRPASLLPAPTSRLRRATGALLRSPVGAALEVLAAPHGVDRYVELVDPLLARDTDRAVVTDVRRETADVTTITLRPSRWRGHRAGQFVRVTVELDGRRHVRCYSVSSSEHRDDGQLTITVKADPDGRVSPSLAHHARPGLVVGLAGPEGEFVLPRRRPERLLLISGGSGITPVMSILRTLVDEDATAGVTFLHYARTSADVPFRAELERLRASRRDLHVITVLTRDPAGSDLGLTGHLSAAHLDAVVGVPTDVEAYVCGPAPLVADATGLWAAAGRDDRLHVERFQPDASAVADPDVAGTVTLARTGASLDNDGRPLLDQAEAAGLSPQYGCRLGICHTCVAPKLAGQVRDARDGRLSSCDPEDVQLCISVPVGDVTIDL